MPMDEAANEAVDWAIKEDLLDGLIESEKDEVIGMILSEYNEEAFIKTLREDGYDEGHSDGFVEGHAEGLAEGKRKGLAEGRSEGLAQGKQEKAIETARNLLKLGLGTAEQIAQAVCLPVEQIKDLACN